MNSQASNGYKTNNVLNNGVRVSPLDKSAPNENDSNNFQPLFPLTNAQLPLKIDIPSYTNDGNNPKTPAAYQHPIWHLGWTDGKCGQPTTTNEELLEKQAIFDWLSEYAIAEQRLAHKEAEVEADKVKQEQSRQKLDEIAKLVQITPFSPVLAIVYFVSAFMLFIADVPLSLSIVEDGFDRAKGWEKWVLSLGIAFSGVFIKYFLDEIIFNKTIPVSQSAPIYSPKSAFNFLPSLNLKGATLSLMLVLFIYTAYLLGDFRATTHAQNIESGNNFITISSVIPDTPSKEEEEKKQQQVEANIRKKKEEISLPFIFLTLTLPIIGGLCFSAGWGEVNKNNLKKLQSVLENTHHQNLLSWKQLEKEVIVEKNRIKREYEQYKSHEVLSTLYQKIYIHGYERGQNTPDIASPNERLHSQFEKALQKLLAKQLKDNIT